MDLDMQLELFEEAMSEIGTMSDLINQVLEVTAEDDDTLRADTSCPLISNNEVHRWVRPFESAERHDEVRS
jgi:hypothetical protein